MPQRIASQETGHVDAPRPLRPFAAMITAEAVSVVAPDGAKPKTNGGRWRVNSGAEMVVYVSGMNRGRDGWEQPIRCVIDLVAAQLAAPVIPALYAHSAWALIGQWRDAQIAADGIDLDLIIYTPRDGIEAAVMPDAVRVKAFLDQDHPWQASVGAWPADGEAGYEHVPAGVTVTVNGRSYSGDGDLPLYVMRKPIIGESSVVLWGADSATGQIAASMLALARSRPLHTPHPESPMPAELKAALGRHPKHHALVAGLVADGKDDAAIDAAVHAAVIAERDAAIAASAKRVGELEAEIAELKKRPVVSASGNPPAFNPPNGDNGAAPKSLAAAIAVVAAEGKLKGFAARAEARRRWPALT